MQATIYTGSYLEDFRNIEDGSRTAYEKESRIDGTILWCKIDIFQLVLDEADDPKYVISKCIPYQSKLKVYRAVGETLGKIATQRGITSYGRIKNGNRFNKDNWEIEDIFKLDSVNLSHFEWGFLSKLSRLVRARSGVQLIGTE